MADSVSSTSSVSTTTATTNVAKNTLGKDDFLKLLVTQMQYQDPSKPMENTDFIAQMAQFTSLEQMNNLVTATQMTQATAYLGKTVAWENDKGEISTGKVSSISLSGSTVNLIIGSDKVSIDKIQSVSETV